MDGHTWLATIVLQRLIQREPNIIVKNAILKLNLLFTGLYKKSNYLKLFLYRLYNTKYYAI